MVSVVLAAGLAYSLNANSGLEAKLAGQAAELQALQDKLEVFEADNAKDLTPEQMSEFGPDCREWIGHRYMDDGLRMIGKTDHKAEITDGWMKKGKIVFEVFLPNQFVTSGSGESYLCVIDPDKETIMKPADSERTYWMR